MLCYEKLFKERKIIFYFAENTQKHINPIRNMLVGSIHMGKRMAFRLEISTS